MNSLTRFILLLLCVVAYSHCSKSLSRASARSKANSLQEVIPIAPPMAPPMPPKGHDKKLKRAIANKIHWDAITINKVQNSIFRDKSTLSINSEDFINKFAILSKTQKVTVAPKPKRVELLDAKRGRIIAIAITRLKPYRGRIVESILNMSLASDVVSTLMQVAPSEEEIKLLLSYKGDPENLSDAEKFLYEIREISDDLRLRAEAWNSMMNFNDQMSVLKSNIDIITRAMEEIESSKNLHKLLRFVLQIGNTINVREVEGIKSSALVKFSEVKSSDGKVLLISQLVQKLQQTPSLYRFDDELKSLVAASKVMSAEELQSMISKFEADVLKIIQYQIKQRGSDDKFQIRFDEFKKSSLEKLEELNQVHDKMIKAIKNTAVMFGEDEEVFLTKGYSEFFNNMCIFVHKFGEARKSLELEDTKKKSPVPKPTKMRMQRR